jgi:hypothetical protein
MPMTQQDDTRMIAHLAEAAERAQDDFGLPHKLRDGSVHHNGCWLDGRVYTLRRGNGEQC